MKRNLDTITVLTVLTTWWRIRFDSPTLFLFNTICMAHVSDCKETLLKLQGKNVRFLLLCLVALSLGDCCTLLCSFITQQTLYHRQKGRKAYRPWTPLYSGYGLIPKSPEHRDNAGKLHWSMPLSLVWDLKRVEGSNYFNELYSVYKSVIIF